MAEQEGRKMQCSVHIGMTSGSVQCSRYKDLLKVELLQFKKNTLKNHEVKIFTALTAVSGQFV